MFLGRVRPKCAVQHGERPNITPSTELRPNGLVDGELKQGDRSLERPNIPLGRIRPNKIGKKVLERASGVLRPNSLKGKVIRPNELRAKLGRKGLRSQSLRSRRLRSRRLRSQTISEAASVRSQTKGCRSFLGRKALEAIDFPNSPIWNAVCSFVKSWNNVIRSLPT